MLRFDRTLLKPEGGTIYLTSSFYSERRELWLNFHYASFQPDHEVEIAIDPKDGTLGLLYGSQTSVQGGYYELQDTFTDGDGQRHPFEQEYRSGEGTYLTIPNYRQYPGPFRFEIIRYWGNVLEMQGGAEKRIR